MQNGTFVVAGGQVARSWTGRVLVAGLLIGASLHTARAQQTKFVDGLPVPSIATSLPQDGAVNRARKSLDDRGISFAFSYTNDLLSNLSGGTRRGTVDQGKLEGQVTFNLDKLFGWRDLTLYANGFQTHNSGRIRRDYVGGMNTIAAIEAAPSVRLSEVWLERKFLDGAASLRVGQLVADNEFFFSDLSTMFLQTDWPTITAVNLPGGAPAYPLSTPGARLKVNVGPEASLLLAVFNGDPAGPCAGDADTCNRNGFNFRLRDRAFVIGEAQWRTNQGKEDTGLARTVKLGAWTHFGQFNDQRFASDGTVLANSLGSGVPARYRGDYGFYGIMDQQIYRPRGAAADSGISLFALASMTPSDRNLVDVQLNGGIVFAGLTPSRPQDRFGASVVYSRFSSFVKAADQDQIAVSGVPGNIRDYEANLELSYVAEIVPGWTLQPVYQYIWHPNGVSGRDARVMGVRSVWNY